MTVLLANQEYTRMVNISSVFKILYFNILRRIENLELLKSLIFKDKKSSKLLRGQEAYWIKKLSYQLE